ncbi:unnamed protein product [Menidia menidia]|uniref:(Atlantic silverside) hypothetical protein n=1 Tax=Menidia menidia TaxID=238744 RepID=A0A8S4B195_9TELE|nr:unnamed protein product [Menidia menidia]
MQDLVSLDCLELSWMLREERAGMEFLAFLHPSHPPAVFHPALTFSTALSLQTSSVEETKAAVLSTSILLVAPTLTAARHLVFGVDLISIILRLRLLLIHLAAGGGRGGEAGVGMAQQGGVGVTHQDTLAVPPMPKHSGLNEDLVKILRENLLQPERPRGHRRSPSSISPRLSPRNSPRLLRRMLLNNNIHKQRRFTVAHTW